MLVPERLWEQMTEDEQRLVNETIQGLRRKGRDVLCPHCDKPVRVLTTHTLVGRDENAVLDQQTQQEAAAARSAIGSVDQRLLEAARTSGLLTAFEDAVRAEKQYGGVPTDVDAFFLLFWRTAQPYRVPAVALAAWKLEFGGFIDVWQANGIVAVMNDGELVAFVPNRLVKPVPISGSGPRPKLSNDASFELWTKSKFGYVPTGSRGFGDALRQANVGKFGAIVQ